MFSNTLKWRLSVKLFFTDVDIEKYILYTYTYENITPLRLHELGLFFTMKKNKKILCLSVILQCA